MAIDLDKVEAKILYRLLETGQLVPAEWRELTDLNKRLRKEMLKSDDFNIAELNAISTTFRG